MQFRLIILSVLTLKYLLSDIILTIMIFVSNKPSLAPDSLNYLTLIINASRNWYQHHFFQFLAFLEWENFCSKLMAWGVISYSWTKWKHARLAYILKNIVYLWPPVPYAHTDSGYMNNNHKYICGHSIAC